MSKQPDIAASDFVPSLASSATDATEYLRKEYCFDVMSIDLSSTITSEPEKWKYESFTQMDQCHRHVHARLCLPSPALTIFSAHAMKLLSTPDLRLRSTPSFQSVRCPVFDEWRNGDPFQSPPAVTVITLIVVLIF